MGGWWKKEKKEELGFGSQVDRRERAGRGGTSVWRPNQGLSTAAVGDGGSRIKGPLDAGGRTG